MDMEIHMYKYPAQYMKKPNNCLGMLLLFTMVITNMISLNKWHFLGAHKD